MSTDEGEIAVQAAVQEWEVQSCQLSRATLTIRSILALTVLSTDTALVQRVRC